MSSVVISNALRTWVPFRDRRGDRLERLAAQLQQASERAARYRLERDSARRERDTNGSQVLYLSEQNRQLRDQLNDTEGVISIRRPLE